MAFKRPSKNRESDMNRFFILILVFSAQMGWAIAPAKQNPVVLDSTHTEIDVLNYYLNNKNWVPVDSVAYHMIEQLIQFMGDKPIDVVAKDLRTMSKHDMIFFDRRANSVRDGDRIPGYIPQATINKQLNRIEQRADDLYPAGRTPVPESLFTGMYISLPLLNVGEEERILFDNLVPISDSIRAKLLSVGSIRDRNEREKAELFRKQYLDGLRRAHNADMVQSFRDSVSSIYRDALRNHYADSTKQAFLDSVFQMNQKAMQLYTDSLVIKENQKVRESLSLLLDKYDMVPNPLTIYGLHHDSTRFSLVNKPGSYKWLWLKNHRNDSIGIKVEVIDKHTVRALVDERVNFSRLAERERLDVKKIEPTMKSDTRLSRVQITKPIENPWKLVGRAYSGITQTYLNDTWKATKGGKSSASIVTTLEYAANYSKDKFKWENGFNAKVGYINYIVEETERDPDARRWHKNSDNIDINSRLGLSAFKKWYYSGEMSFKTQTFYGFKNATDKDPISAFMAPATLSFSLGMDYKPNKDFSAFLSPISLRTTYVLNDLINPTAHGLDADTRVKQRVGMNGKVYLYRKLMENVMVKTNNDVFINFNPDFILKFPDFQNETQIDFKVNQYITTQFNINMIYDKSILTSIKDADGVEIGKEARLQLKQYITFGFSYRF
jgi:hypothetical protein